MKVLHHIDTSSFLIKRNIAIELGRHWLTKWTGDRSFYNALKKNYPEYTSSTLKYTLNYHVKKVQDGCSL